MKRVTATMLLLLAVCMCLGGCTSTRYSELENRISRLEELLGTSKSTPTPSTTHFTYDTPAPTALPSTSTPSPTPLPPTSPAETTPSPTSALPSTNDLSDASADDIVTAIIYYIDERPRQGDTYESIKARMLCQPATFETDYGVSATFDGSASVDRFASIYYWNCFLEMDGVSVGVSENSIGVTVKLTVMEYEKAKEVFEGLREWASSADSNLNVNQSGKHWQINWYSKYGNHSAYNYVTMERTDAGYDISVHLD